MEAGASNHVVKLDETAARSDAREAALFEALGLVRRHHISRRELEQIAAEVARDRSAIEARIDEVLAVMNRAGLTIADLAEATPSVKHYRHPVTGETWNGQGGQPDWLRRALLGEGYRPKELRVT